MDAQKDIDTSLTSTPAKVPRADCSDCVLDDDKQGSSMLVSPEHLRFPRIIPPAISMKARKVNCLLGDRDYSHRRGLKKGDVADTSKPSEHEGLTPADEDGGEEKATKAMKFPASCFSSPTRPSRGQQAGTDRFTPQRNLGGLFASPIRQGRSPVPVQDPPYSPIAGRPFKLCLTEPRSSESEVRSSRHI